MLGTFDMVVGMFGTAHLVRLVGLARWWRKYSWCVMIAASQHLFTRTN